MEHNFKNFFKELGLEFMEYKSDRGVRFRRSGDEADENVTRAFGRGCFLWSDQPKALHALRITARARALAQAASTRLDTEGIGRVDLEASSTRPWKSFWKGLSREQRNLVTIFRAGAMSTATRRRLVQLPECHLCGMSEFPSTRHLLVECRHFDAARSAINTKFALSNAWWLRLPRVSSKSGWITFEAHRSQERRGELQVAINSLAIEIMCDPGVSPRLHGNRQRGFASTSQRHAQN